MRIAVTGSKGFVGSKLVNALKTLQVEVIEIDLDIGFDLRNWDSLSGIESFDILFHLAAKSYVPESFTNPGEFYKTNVIGTLHALELCRKYNAKMIYTSSYVYGAPEYLPIDEEHPVKAFNPYAQSKLLGEDLCKAYNRDFNISTIILRPFNIYGKGQGGHFLIPMIINQAEKGVVKLKDSRPKRDFVYIDDVISAYINSIEYNNSSLEIFNIGSGISISIKEVTELISKHYNKSLQIIFSEEQRKNEVLDTIANISKVNNLLKWHPKYTLEMGIKEMIRINENI